MRPLLLASTLICAAHFARAQAPTSVVDYATTPTLGPEMFLGSPGADSGSLFRPQIQYGATSFDRYNQYSAPLWDARAITFPRANVLERGPDSAAAMAYFEAMWHIAGYHAALLKSRLRREMPRGGLFGMAQVAPYQAEAINAGVQAEWEKVNLELVTETANGQDLMRSLGFADQYARAVDTVTYPLAVVKPHGMELHMTIGPSFPGGGLSDRLSAGFAMDLGIGYTYDRWLVLLAVMVNQTPVASTRDAPPELVEARSQWNNVGLDLGYRWLRQERWEATGRLRIMGADLKTGGSGDTDQVSLRNDFALGLGQSVSYQFGNGGYRGELDSGRRSGFRALALLSYTPQKWLEGLAGPVVSAGIGFQMTFYGVGYR